jgi:hypothetical protein
MHCHTCQYWVSGDGELGHCHRFPPVLVAIVTTDFDHGISQGSVSTEVETRHPVTGKYDYCGEHKGVVRI